VETPQQQHGRERREARQPEPAAETQMNGGRGSVLDAGRQLADVENGGRGQERNGAEERRQLPSDRNLQDQEEGEIEDVRSPSGAGERVEKRRDSAEKQAVEADVVGHR